MSVRRKSSKKALSAFTSLMVLFALVVPFAGTALAQHVSRITITPTSDTAAAGTCNAFTATLTGPTSAGDPNPGVEGETVDIIVQDTDADDNAGLNGGANESDVSFCTPPATQQTTGSDEFGPNPRPVTPNATNQNNQPDNTATRQQGSTTPTDVNGQITFGITSPTTGTFAVTVFFDENNDNDPAGEFTANASKTFTAAAQQGSQAVRTLDCSPEEDRNPEGTQHEFVCVATDVNGNPVQGATVTFDVTAGPNAEEINNTNCVSSTNNAQGQPGDTTPNTGTSSTGQATCRYQDLEDPDQPATPPATNTSPPGTDTIVAFVNQTPGAGQTGSPGADSFEPQDTITKTFVGDANNIDCTGPASARAGSIVTITCTVTDEVGQPVPNVFVSFTNDGAGVFRQFQNTSGQCTTNANGVCSVQVETNESEEGQDVVVTATIVQGTATGAGATGLPGNTSTDSTFRGDTNCSGSTGNAQTGTTADCTDTVTVALTGAAPPPPPPPPPLAQCEDGVDNDGDGRIDFPNDTGCANGDDNSENTEGGGGGGGGDPEEIRRARTLKITELKHVRLPGKRRPALLVKGRVTSTNFADCAVEVPVKVQIFVGGEFVTRKSDTTNGQGVFKVLIRDVQARYRAVATKFQIEDTANNQINICLKANDIRRHRHRRG